MIEDFPDLGEPENSTINGSLTSESSDLRIASDARKRACKALSCSSEGLPTGISNFFITKISQSQRSA